MVSRSSEWPDIEQLIPHRPPILMIEEIVERSDEGLLCRGRLPCSAPVLLLELAAQATAVMTALGGGDRPGGEPKIGYLVAIQQARFPVRETLDGRPLLAAVQPLRGVPPLRRYAVQVSLEEGAVELVSATLTTYQAPAG